MQVQTSLVADALTFYDDADTTGNKMVFIRTMDSCFFFDCLNVKKDTEGIKKRKPMRGAYTDFQDERFKVVPKLRIQKWLLQLVAWYSDTCIH